VECGIIEGHEGAGLVKSLHGAEAVKATAKGIEAAKGGGIGHGGNELTVDVNG